MAEKRRGVTMAERMAEALGGGAVLGPGVRGWGDLAGRARGGIPWGALEALSKRLGTGIADLAGVLRIPARTLARRRKAGFFDADESDRILRIARVAAIAGEVIGDAGRASAWLCAPNRALGGPAPIDVMDTDLGCRMVEDVLGRLDHGVVG